MTQEKLRANGNSQLQDVTIHLKALTYLVTAMIQRLGQTNASAQELLDGINSDRRALASAAPEETEAVFQRAIEIVERAVGLLRSSGDART